MLKVIEFIKNNSNWRDILTEKPYYISIKDDGDFTLLKYSQVDSDFSNEIVRECRGLIIDKYLNPVCIPFFKFGNYGESYADDIDWSSAKVEEKIDGSLIKVWNYNGDWIVSTSGNIFAKNAKLFNDNLEEYTPFNNFAELFNAASAIHNLNFNNLNPLYTYMFELISPYNKVVIPYELIDIYHIGTRNNITLEEIEVDINIKKPKTYNCDNLNDLIEMAKKLKWCNEGYVVKDKKYNRIKVKSPAYVAVHHFINGMGESYIIELLRNNEVEEFCLYFPEYKPVIERLSKMINEMISYLNNIIKNEVDNINFETRKDFAIMATKTKYPSFLFSYYDKKVKDPKEWVWSMTNDKILQNLEKI